MKLLETKQGIILNVYVKPLSREFKLTVEKEGLVVFSREPPVKGRVNRELVKELSKIFGANVQIVSGQTSKQKRMLIANISATQVNSILNRYIDETKP